jgi:uncharacterized protein YciI
MAYMIETWDGPGRAELRQNTRPAHMAYLDANVGRVLAAGAKLSDDGETASGTLYIIDTDSREEAEAFLAADPFTRAGLPELTVVSRWRKGFFNFENLVQR